MKLKKKYEGHKVTVRIPREKVLNLEELTKEDLEYYKALGIDLKKYYTFTRVKKYKGDEPTIQSTMDDENNGSN